MIPAPEIQEWARELFINPQGAMFSTSHEHLESANVAFLWAFRPCFKGGLRLWGQAEACLPPRVGNAWAKAAWEQQQLSWFGSIPDFKITLDAEVWAGLDDTSALSLVKHELLHCGQRHDEEGNPMYDAEGLPKLAIRGHDVEEFVEVVEWFGPSQEVRELVRAAGQKPIAGRASIAAACGTCRRVA